jgi:hypothetical protein
LSITAARISLQTFPSLDVGYIHDFHGCITLTSGVDEISVPDTRRHKCSVVTINLKLKKFQENNLGGIGFEDEARLQFI